MDNNRQNKFDTEPLDLDDLLPQVGEFGRYQKLLLWFVCLPACFPCGFCAFNQLFMSETPDHWCRTSQISNFTVEQRRNLSIPRTNGFYSKCRRYSVNWTYILEAFNCSYDDIVVNTSWPTEECIEGWEFQKPNATSSIVTAFTLVCDKNIYPTLGLVALNLGGPVGVYYFGLLNDSIGRKKSFFACLSTLLLGSILTVTAQNFWWWAGSRIIVGLTVPAIYQIPFIISLELVGPNYRSFVTVMICLFYTFGLLMLAGITYLIRDWVHLAMATSFPFILYYLYWFLLPESPRWLLAKGRFEEASKILETLARINRKDLPSSFKQQLKQRLMYRRSVSEEEALRRRPPCTALCSTPNMRLKTILITLSWFANELVYVGLSYYGPSLGSDEYMSFFLSSAVEIPSYLMCWLMMDRWGRRWPMCLCMIICGICCITTYLLPNDSDLISLFFLIAKFAIAASFLIIYPFAGELFPTQFRGLGIGIAAYIGGLGRIIVPFVTFLGSEMIILPLLIMGIISVLGGLIGLRLPETLHYRLPQTLEEGEEFGKNYTMQDCVRCIPLKPEDSSFSSQDNMELEAVAPEPGENTPLGRPLRRKISMQKLVRQSSIMDTPKDADGNIQITNWF